VACELAKVDPASATSRRNKAGRVKQQRKKVDLSNVDMTTSVHNSIRDYRRPTTAAK
jgi:hypothetical protein